MTNASLPAAATTSHEDVALGQKNKRTSILASLLKALHDSRRLQARRILRQYQHLIEQPEDSARSRKIESRKHADE